MLIAFNKPYGVLCQFTDRSTPPRPTLAGFGLPPGVYAAGRLDHDSEGLLLLTDDGPLANRLTNPRHKQRKTYWVQVEGDPREEQLRILREGVTLNDGTTTTVPVALAATRPAGLLISLNVLVPSTSAGKYIRSVDTCTLSATTGTAGSFGITATRVRMTVGVPLANYKITANWADLGLPEIKNSACLFPIVLTSTSSTGTVRGGGKIVHG